MEGGEEEARRLTEDMDMTVTQVQQKRDISLQINCYLEYPCFC